MNETKIEFWPVVMLNGEKREFVYDLDQDVVRICLHVGLADLVRIGAEIQRMKGIRIAADVD